MDFNGLPLLGLPSEATGGIVTSGSQEVPDGTSRRFCELVEVVFPDTSSDEAIARALQAGRAVTEEPEESAPDFSEAGNSTEGLPVVTYDEDTASRHTAQRLNSLRRDSVIPSTPRINSDPSFWEPHVSEDRQRLLLHLKEFGLCEYEVAGDGNCQFRSLSDQLYRSADYHAGVRKEIVRELRANPRLYKGYVSADYRKYCSGMAKDGTWGDHVTLQAAANTFGLQILLITSYEESFVLSIEPKNKKGDRVLYLSFWAEVHYNSVYPASDPPNRTADACEKKRKKVLGSQRLGNWLAK
mmetsp:Transcript_31191/g.74135  ORF Transcript_31191/g.74135 Transcript_31191/m.74135 type:complete len:298 (-) Transcript_31191:328-1221(-)